MSDPTPNLDLTTVPTGTLEPSGPINDALQILDAVIQLSVEAADLTVPPTTIADDAGKRWIVADSATGAWSGHDGEVALCTGSTLWRFIVPGEGWFAWNKDNDEELSFDGSAWVVAGGGSGTGDVDGPASSIDDRIATFDGTTGKLLQDGGKTIAEVRAPTIKTTVSSNTITPDGDTDLVRPAALSAGLTIANPSTTPADGWGMVFELKDNGTTRTLTWGSKYAGRCSALPTATIAGKQHVIGASYNAADDKLYCDYALVQP